jgi:hypothetical protein
VCWPVLAAGIADAKPQANNHAGASVKKTALFCGVVAAAATAAMIIGLRSAGKADVPGFLGLGIRRRQGAPSAPMF